MTRFELVTQWRFATSVDAVWDALYSVEDWPRWWPYVKRVELLQEGDAAGVGAVRRYTWSSRLPYQLTFDMRSTLVERPHRLQGEASGELQGRGRWTLEQVGSETQVRYDWEVDVTRPWMRAFAPLLAPAFRWNHAEVMRAGGRGLAKHLQVALLQA